MDSKEIERHFRITTDVELIEMANELQQRVLPTFSRVKSYTKVFFGKDTIFQRRKFAVLLCKELADRLYVQMLKYDNSYKQKH